MPDFFKKLMSGHTKGQIKNRNKRFQKRKARIEELLGAAAIQLEYNSLDEMLQALLGQTEPHLPDLSLVRTYILDWRRKESHGGTQSWYILCNGSNVVETVVWTMTSNLNGNMIQGGKIYNMTQNTVEVVEEVLNLV
jgi:hypothetical protein